MRSSDPTPGDDDVALQDLAGNDLASFTAPATNNSAVEPVPALQPALPLTGYRQHSCSDTR